MIPLVDTPASGTFNVSVPPRDTGEPDTLMSEPDVPRVREIDELASCALVIPADVARAALVNPVIGVLVANVNLPCASTVYDATDEAFPYVPAMTAVLAKVIVFTDLERPVEKVKAFSLELNVFQSVAVNSPVIAVVATGIEVVETEVIRP